MIPRAGRALLACFALVLAAGATPGAASAGQSAYFPPAGHWARKSPATVGMGPAKLAAAIAFAKAHETDWPKDFSRQAELFGAPLGPVPGDRARSNAVVIRNGYVVAEFGDTGRADPCYSVAKGMLSTVAGIALRDGGIASLDEPVGERIRDGGYDSPRNARVTWRMHLQQESEWQGELWGKMHDFVGNEAFGRGARQARALREPGTRYEYNDVRINRLSLSLLRLSGKPLAEVFRDAVMRSIGASDSWQWVPYRNSYAEVGGRTMPSVSGGSRWGGGVWISTLDMARFGYLWLRGGRWGGRQIIPSAYVAAALTPGAHGPDYGYLWWLNTRGMNFPGLPADAYAARGAGGNTIFISPGHDLVIVWRWHSEARHADAEFFRMIVEAIGR